MSTLANQPAHSIAPIEPAVSAGGYAPPMEEATLSFADIVRILKQRKVAILVTAVIVFVLSLIGTFLTSRFFPAYTSEAVFELSPPMRGGLNPVEDYVATDAMEQMLQTEASKVRGLALLLEVAANEEIKNTDYYRWYESDAMKCAMGLKKDLIAQPIPDTRLFRVALSCRSNAEARLIVKTVTDRYLRTYSSNTEDEAQARLTTLVSARSDLYRKLQEKRDALRAQREKTNVSSAGDRVVMNAEYVGKLLTTISEIDASVASIQAQLESLGGLDPSQLPLTADQRLIIESDPMLRYYRSQVEAIDVEIQASALLIGENHRQVQVLRERRAGFFAKEIAKRQELMTEVRTRQIESLRDELARRRAHQARLQDALAAAEAENRDAERSMLMVKQIEGEIEQIQYQITNVESEVTSAELVLKDKSRVRLKRVQEPQEAVKPSRPNIPVYLGGGFVLALLAGVGVAFLREFTDKAIRTPVDVARFGHLSVLGTVPLLDDEEADVEDAEDAVRKAPHSLIAEQFRKIRTSLVFSGKPEAQRVILVTSPSPGDGKTTVAINLATTFAHSNHTVLLIDCNFRRPAIRERFAGTRPEGLSNVLIGQATLDDVSTRTDVPNLSVLSSGPMPPRPAELLGSQAMRDLIAAAAAKYDRVILDGPPALLISDAVVLALQVNGVVLVSRAEANTKGALKRAREQLESVGARVFGAVLNGVRARAGGYFRQQYREFYDYTSDETIPPGVAELPPGDAPKD